MTNAYNLLQFGLIFFTSALQLNREPSQNTRQNLTLCGEKAKAVIQLMVDWLHLDFVMPLCFHS